jgi:hypothetical protein
VPLGREDGVEEDTGEGDLDAALVAERVIDDDPDDAARDEVAEDQCGQDEAQVIRLPGGGSEDGIGSVVMAPGGPSGGLPDLADGPQPEADDPSGEQRLEGGEDLRVEAIAEGLYSTRRASEGIS